MTDLAETQWIAVGETARRLQCSSQWVRELVRARKLRFFRTPYGLLLDEESVDALVARRAALPKDAIGRLRKGAEG